MAPTSTHPSRAASRRTLDPGSQRTSSRHLKSSTPSTWDGLKVYKVALKKVTSADALIKLWDEGEVVIRRDDNTTPDRNLITAILSTSGLPEFISKSKDNIRKLVSKKC